MEGCAREVRELGDDGRWGEEPKDGRQDNNN
jgi:hypothetical protein